MEKASRLHLLLLALLLTLALPGVAFAQNLKVQGCVTDEQNEPLVGVSVQTKDKSKGTVTDIDGNYVLSGVPRGATLVFSYVGYMPKEVKVTSATVNVVMDESNEQLDEMVVIGYGQQRKVTLTGSVANVGGKELLKSPAASLGNALSGKYLDSPWRPSDLEQREGRAIRKGNEVVKLYNDNKVDVIIYAVERSLDAYKFNLLHCKQTFIAQLIWVRESLMREFG